MGPDFQARRKAEFAHLSVQQLLVLCRSAEVGHDTQHLLEAIARERLASQPEGSEELLSLLEIITARLSEPEQSRDWQSTSRKQIHSPDASLAHQAEETYRAHLPRLLVERPGQWVAYHGRQLVGFATTDVELYRKCRELGLSDGDYVVRPIEPSPPDVLFFLDRPVGKR